MIEFGTPEDLRRKYPEDDRFPPETLHTSPIKGRGIIVNAVILPSGIQCVAIVISQERAIYIDDEGAYLGEYNPDDGSQNIEGGAWIPEELWFRVARHIHT